MHYGAISAYLKSCYLEVFAAGTREMRCHFHLVNGHEIIHDEAGVEVSGLEEARAEALKAIEEMRQADVVATNYWEGWRLNVAEITGRVLFSIPLN